jgi:hypothetical protein
MYGSTTLSALATLGAHSPWLCGPPHLKGSTRVKNGIIGVRTYTNSGTQVIKERRMLGDMLNQTDCIIIWMPKV